jgi:hypothetical protein
MSPQLRDALNRTARDAGCSLNGFAVQVLAAAAGHDARFRPPATEPTIEEESNVLRTLERDHVGNPIDRDERLRHLAARQMFIAVMQKEISIEELGPLVRRLDIDDPAHYVEWEMRRQAEEQAS